MMNMLRLTICAILAIYLLPCMGQTDSIKAVRPVTRATLYGVGAASVYDTYLSPQAYKGINFKVLRESTRATRWMDGRLVRQSLFQTDVNYTHNRADNNNTLAAMANWNWGLHYNFPLTHNFRLLAGALIDINGGFVYNMRNGNNPAQARAYVNLDASGMAVWDLRIRRYPITLRYQLHVPLIGAMFMPHYGESYYEIFSLGNSDGVVSFTSLHNQPSLRHLLSADLPVKRLCKIRVAYMWDAQQADINHIRTHHYTHTFLVGFVKQFVPL